MQDPARTISVVLPIRQGYTGRQVNNLGGAQADGCVVAAVLVSARRGGTSGAQGVLNDALLRRTTTV